MSSAVLKFQKATPEPKDLGILAAAVEVLVRRAKPVWSRGGRNLTKKE
jgi:hypothetical protein